MIEAVVERLDGAPVGEPRRWSDEFKAQAVSGAMAPDINVSALARRLGISPGQLFGWRRAFLKTQDESTSALPSPQALMEIVIGDAIIRVGQDIAEADLRGIIRAVRTA
ncbi:MAG: transposase [Rhodobacterales bacterium]|uniref:transposase n=1 Tax=Puniceibacterium antarcticum TaxID=1206336 RepID=UPI0015D4A849|nr:transposase [Puniceibacterium antarcticum]